MSHNTRTPSDIPNFKNDIKLVRLAQQPVVKPIVDTNAQGKEISRAQETSYSV